MKVYLKRDGQNHWLLWWSSNGFKFYPINEKRVQAALDPEPKRLDEKLRVYRERMNHIYQGSVETFNGEYSFQQKTLTLKA